MLILITTALFILKQISQTVKKAGFPLVRKPALSFLHRLKTGRVNKTKLLCFFGGEFFLLFNN